MTEFFDGSRSPVCEPCQRAMVLIRGPVGNSPVWQPKVWFCEGCRAAVDIDVAGVDDAATGPVEVTNLAPKLCPQCADDDEIFEQRMSPICGRQGADERGRGRWYLTHWYCALCERLESLADAERVEVAA